MYFLMCNMSMMTSKILKLVNSSETQKSEYLVNEILLFQKQPPEVSYKKDVLKNFAKFTGKHLCQSLFFNKVAG